MEAKKVTLPDPRLKLKAKLYEKGFKTIQDFSKQIGVDSGCISRVLSGGEYPSRNMQIKLMEALGLTSDEFQSLL